MKRSDQEGLSMKWTSHPLIVLFAAGVLCCFIACTKSPESTEEKAAGGAAPSSPSEKFPLILNWFPEVEHAGFYAAQVHGLYSQAGLNVDIQPGGPNLQVVPRVASEPGSFCIANADELLQAVAQGVPAVALMAGMQDSPRCIMVHEKAGITRLEDLKNLSLAADVSLPFMQFLQKKLPLTGVTLVPYTGSVAEFLVKPDYAQQAYVISEPFVAKSKGGDPQCLMTSSLGFNPYASVLITSRDTLTRYPERVQKMVQASIQGWRQYVQEPAKTNAQIRTVNPELGEEALGYGTQSVIPLVQPVGTPAENIGTMTEARWKELLDQLVEIGILAAGAVELKTAVELKYLSAPAAVP